MKPPIKPINNQYFRAINSYSGMSLYDLIQEVNKRHIDPKNVYIECEVEESYDNYYAILNIGYYDQEYSPEEFKEKISEYRKELRKYNKWLKEEFPKLEAERIQKEIDKLKEKKRLLN